LDSTEIGCAIILSPIDQLNAHQASWLNAQPWKPVEFYEPCLGYRLRKLKPLYLNFVAYRILIKP
jgi:hypothetical protein